MSNKKNKKILLIAPSSTFKRKDFRKGVKILEEEGFLPVFEDNIFEKYFNYAGTDSRKKAELEKALLSDIKIIMAVRGGYGATSFLDTLKDIKDIDKKLFLGASDISALHLFFLKYYGNIKPVLGPMLISDFAENRINMREFKRIVNGFLNNKKIIIKLGFKKTINRGKPIEGESFASCLTLLSLSLGTFFEPSLENRVLFLEDINEDSSRIIRFLEHLENCDKFKNINGIIFNDFPHKDKTKKRDLIKKLKHFFKNKPYTVLYGAKFGHSIPRHYIPFGFDVKTEDRKIILEGKFD